MFASNRFRRVVAITVASIAVMILAVLLVSCVLLFPPMIVNRSVARAGTATLGPLDRLSAENDVRLSLLQALGGLLAVGGILAGAVMTLRQIRVNREGHTIELFTKAIDQLASKDVSVRHGGIYALEFLAELGPRYTGKVHALLTGFIRERAPWPPDHPDADVRAERVRLQEGAADDIGGAIGALRRGSMITDGAWSELEKVHLRDAQLDGYDVPRTCFIGSNLTGASLVGADLTDASMTDTILRNANLSRATLSGADLSCADLEGANLDNVVFDSKTKWPPDFAGATFPPSPSALPPSTKR
jgi:Pentapeptide repeats (8 copies)